MARAESFQLVTPNGTLRKRLGEVLSARPQDAFPRVVSIFGCQSSGKSTLLNRLFGTSFETMDALQGRQQTTRGIWASVLPDSDGGAGTTVVLDLEGTDSRERAAEGEAAFERQASCFALALSDVLVINMWCQDVGRHNASNFALLKTVLEVNLELMEREAHNGDVRRSMLLFVLRDHVESTTPLARLQEQIAADIAQVWRSMAKPSSLEDSHVDDVFDVCISSLPHKELEAAKFDDAVDKLRLRFTAADSGAYVFRSEYSRKIPCDSFALFSQNVWETVRSNRELDIPSERLLAAQFRCGEIAEEILTGVKKEALPTLQSKAGKSDADTFASGLTDCVEQALSLFDKRCARYEPSAVSAARADLGLRLSSLLEPLYGQYIATVADVTAASLHQKLEPLVPSEVDPTYAFQKEMDSVVNSAREELRAKCARARPQGCLWDFTSAERTLERVATGAVSSARRAARQALSVSLARSAQRNAAKHVAGALEPFDDGAWDRAKSALGEAGRSVEQDLQTAQENFGLDARESEEVRRATLRAADEGAKQGAAEALSGLDILMVKAFNAHFLYGKDGAPREWKPRDNVRIVFVEAQRRAMQVSERARQGGELSLPDAALAAAEERFRTMADAEFKATLHEVQQMRSNTRVPPAMWIAMLVLGWNELVSILTTPSYLVFALLLGTVFVYVRLTGSWAAVATIARMVLSAIETGLDRLHGEVRKDQGAADSPSSYSPKQRRRARRTPTRRAKVA